MAYSTRTRDRFRATVAATTGVFVAGTITGTGAAVALVAHESALAQQAKEAPEAWATESTPLPTVVATRTITAVPSAAPQVQGTSLAKAPTSRATASAPKTTSVARPTTAATTKATVKATTTKAPAPAPATKAPVKSSGS